VHAKVVTVDVGGDGHRLEALDEHVVDLLVLELLEDLGAESEMLGHRSRLVVASQHGHVSREVDLEAKEEDADLEREDAAIYVVSQEEQIGPRDALRIDHLLEHVNHIKELAMNITNDDYWLFHA